MYEVKVLKPGYAHWIGPAQQKAAGTVTLIEGPLKIIVDTGIPSDKNQIISALKKKGIEPHQIDFVVCTHGQSDHIGNNNLFPQATFIVSYDISKGDLYTFHKFDESPYKICDLIEVIATPGHTDQGLSVIVKTARGVVAITGDLFECEGDLDHEDLWRAFSELPDGQEKNRARILHIADFIVPGHGDMFRTKRVDLVTGTTKDDEKTTQPSSPSQVVKIGTLKADQVLIGDSGKQFQIKGDQVGEDSLDKLFLELQGLTLEQTEIEQEEKDALIATLLKFRDDIEKERLSPIDAAKVTQEIVTKAPWLKKKIGELTTGASGSIIAAAIVEGIKFALKFL